jgi:hypothetical protein
MRIVLLHPCLVANRRRILGWTRPLTVVAVRPEEECDADDDTIYFALRGRKAVAVVPRASYVPFPERS